MLKESVTLTVILMTVLLTACSGKSNPSEAEHTNQEQVANGDLREKTESIDELPTFLDGAHQNLISIYANVPNHQELLEHMPCYCGCGDSAGHTSNYDCFVHENFADGSLQWDDHGTRCGVCLEIANYSMKRAEKGEHPLEIRNAVDQAYKEGYAQPTNTPMPSGS